MVRKYSHTHNKLTHHSTGSGKSYTMMGAGSDDHLKGIIPRLCDTLFERIAEVRQPIGYNITRSTIWRLPGPYGPAPQAKYLALCIDWGMYYVIIFVAPSLPPFLPPSLPLSLSLPLPPPLTPQNDNPKISYKVEVSYMEIYCEKVRDLLCPKGWVRFDQSECPIPISVLKLLISTINFKLMLSLRTHTEASILWRSENTRFWDPMLKVSQS